MSLSNLAIPSLPDVPFAAGVPAVLRNPQAAANSIVNSASNQIVGAAQQAVGAVQNAVGGALSGAVGGAISNVQSALGNIPGGGAAAGLINGAFGAPATLLSSDSPAIQTAASQPGQWGIYDQAGNLIVAPDSFKELDYKQSWRIADYPMEKGAFQSYNKVQTPYIARVTLTKGGSDTDRTSFLSALDAAANSTDLYNVSSPEWPYNNVSIEQLGYKRNAVNGVALLTVELGFIEIRVAPPATFSNTAAPNGADQTNGGVVQAVPITTGPSMTNGQPTSSAQFESGTNDPPPLASDAQSAPAGGGAANNGVSTYVAPTKTETPAVQDTSPKFPVAGTQGPSDPPLGADGKPLTQEQVAAGTPYYTVNPLSGNLQATTIDSEGSHTHTVPTPPKVQ